MSDARVNEIIRGIKRIKNSKQSVKKYFETHKVPFSRKQYYKYCKTLELAGEIGLKDQREKGNFIKLTPRIRDYIVMIIEDDPGLSATQIQKIIYQKFERDISNPS